MIKYDVQLAEKPEIRLRRDGEWEKEIHSVSLTWLRRKWVVRHIAEGEYAFVNIMERIN